MTQMNNHNGWLPGWLAAYIFVAGMLFMELAVNVFCVFAYEHEIEYSWHFGIVMIFIFAVPWVWYFMYVAKRFLDKIPLLYSLLVAAPFITYTHSVLSRETLYSTLFTFGGDMYFFRIGWESVIVLVLVATVVYELAVHMPDYIRCIDQMAEAITGGPDE